jgi:F-type H+-transporting ATPase subunit c
LKQTIVMLSAASVSVALGQVTAGSTSFFTLTDAMCLAAMAVASVGCALAQGHALARAVDGIARQPEAAGKIQGVLLLGLGFIESLAIYVLVICLIIIFANPASSVIAH